MREEHEQEQEARVDGKHLMDPDEESVTVSVTETGREDDGVGDRDRDQAAQREAETQLRSFFINFIK